MTPLWFSFKLRSRKLKSFLCLLLLLCIQILFISIHTTTSNSFRSIPILNSSLTPDNRFVHYPHLIDLFQQQDFLSQPIQLKAHLYFDALYKFDQDWQISDFANLRYFKKLSAVPDLSLYSKKECEKEWAKLNLHDSDQRKQICSVVRATILKNWKQNQFIESEIFNFIGHLRIFNLLYILEDSLYPAQFHSFEQRLFPMLTGALPVFSNYQGQVFENEIPNLSNAPDFSGDPYQGENLIQYMLNAYKSRGIVLSCMDRDVKDTVNLVKVLRYLANDLPIQVVFRNDELSKESRDRIMSLARDDELDTLGVKQELWFVDLTPCVKDEYSNFFNSYSSKFLLTIFNSFDEMIFMDNDAIPFVNPAQFFELSNYKKSKALFFKDRNFKNRGLNPQILNFYRNLLPSSQFDSKIFKIPSVTNEEILRNNFFKGLSKHFIDSGLLVMKKKSHLGGVLASLHLSTWVPTSSFVYGDKELFWLGQLMVGNQISFSNHFASSLGEISNYSANTRKICSSKLAHLSKDYKILWMNGGLNYCNVKQINENDLNLAYKGRFKDLHALEEFYHSSFKINGVIVTSSDLNDYPNKDGEPIRNWEFEPQLGCNNRFFCSFESFGPLDKKVSNKLIEYDQSDTDHYDAIVSVWNNGLT